MARRSDHSREELHKMALQACTDIVREKGITGLRMRLVAQRIGYTVGTLYQMFKNLDDLVEQMNAQTLQNFFDHCGNVQVNGNPAEALKRLGREFNQYAAQEENLWGAVILYSFQPGYRLSEDYNQKVVQLLGLIMKTTAPYYKDGEQELALHEARVLWASLYGIYSLSAADRLAPHETTEALADSVVDFFVSSKNATGP